MMPRWKTSSESAEKRGRWTFWRHLHDSPEASSKTCSQGDRLRPLGGGAGTSREAVLTIWVVFPPTPEGLGVGSGAAALLPPPPPPRASAKAEAPQKRRYAQ